MAAEVEYWDVVIGSDDRSKRRLFQLPVATTMKEVLEIYAHNISVDPRSIVLLTLKGDRVADNYIMKDIERVCLGVNLIRLTAADAAKVPRTKGVAPVSMDPLLLDLYPIRVRLPESRSILLNCRASETLGSIVDLLRRCSILMGVREVRSDEAGCLSANPGWRQLPIKQCGVGLGKELFVDALLPLALRIDIRDGINVKNVMKWMVAITETCVDWENIMDTVRRLCKRPIDGATVVTQGGAVYWRDGHSRCSVLSYGVKDDVWPYLDEDDGYKDDGSHRTHLLIDFVTSGSGIRAAPLKMPVITVWLNTVVCVLEEDGRLKTTYIDDFFNPHYVLLLSGLLLRENSGDEALLMLMLRLRSDKFVNVADGTVFLDDYAVTSSISRDSCSWIRALILVGVGDTLPRWKIPEEQTVWIYNRCGKNVGVLGNTVTSRRINSADVSGSRWVASWRVSPLDTGLTRRMRTD